MSSETNSIEEKKSITDESSDKWTSFIGGVSAVVVYIILFIWILGTCLLYSTKVSRSNIIPSDFTNTQTTNINLVNANYVRELSISTEKPYLNIGKYTAQELQFFKDGPSFIEKFLNYLKPTDSNSSFSFLHEFFKDFFSINNSVIKIIYNTLYGLNESLLMLFSPFIYLFIFIFYSTFYFWGFFFFQIYKLIKSIIFPSGDSSNTHFWSNIHPIFNFFLFPFYLFLIILFSFFSSLFSCVFSIPYALFGLLGYNYHLTTDTSSEKPSYGFLTLLNSFMKYKVSFVMILISLAVLSNSNAYLSGIYIAGSFIAIIILAFMGIYNYVPDPNDNSQITRIIKNFK
jgi:hypothetical protein